ncbi:MAG: hypothetical protein VCE75_05255 [Alphaproteobacteria bacterium]
MNNFLLVWLISALVVLGAVYLLKSLRQRRLAGLDRIHWPGLVVIAMILGAVPAFIYNMQTPRSVSVPDGVAERPKIADPAKN